MFNGNNGSIYGVKSSKIVSFILQRTGTYEDQYLRPFNSGLTGTTQNEILNAYSEKGSLSAIEVGAMVGEFIRPSYKVDCGISIPNGWEIERVRFYMNVQVEDHSGSIINEHIIGYTDHNGISANLNIDDNMIFYINAISKTRLTRHQTPMGNQSYLNMLSSKQILSNENSKGIFTNNNLYNMSPASVTNRIFSIDMRAELSEYDGENTTLYDQSTTLSKTPIKSDRENNTVSTYATSILNGFYDNLKATEDVYSSSYGDMLEKTSTFFNAKARDNDTFLQFLNNKSGINVNSFTKKDLFDFDSNVQHVTKVIPVDSFKNDLHYRGRGDSWSGSDMTTIFASAISNTLPTFMLDRGISKVRIIATNMTFNCTTDLQVCDVRSFNMNMDISKDIEILKFRLINELLKGLTYSNSIQFQLELLVDVLGETHINISINNEPIRLFVCPTFSDALLSPIITNDVNTLDSIAGDFNNLFSDIGSQHNTERMINEDLDTWNKDFTSTPTSGFLPQQYNPTQLQQTTKSVIDLL